MTNSTRKRQFRVKPRFAARNLEAQVEIAAAAIDGIAAKVVDLSQGGAEKLALPAPLAAEEPVRVSIKDEESHIDLTSNGKVCWSQPTHAERWHVGVAFNEEITDGDLERLAATGKLDRRIDQRMNIDMDAEVRQELAGAVASPVKLLDYGCGGIRFLADRTFDKGSRILVEYKDANGETVIAPARIAWLKPSGDQFEVGASFADRSGHALMHATVQKRNTQPASEPATQTQPEAIRLSTWGWVGLIVATWWLAAYAIGQLVG